MTCRHGALPGATDETPAEAGYRRNAAAVRRLLQGLDDPAARRRAVRALMLHHLDRDDGPSVCAAILIRHGIRPDEEPLLERWTLGCADPEQFGFVAFLSAVSGQAASVLEVAARYGRPRSQRLVILATAERLLRADDPVAAAARWPADGAAPARVLLDRAAKLVHVLARPRDVLALRRIIAEIDRAALAAAPSVRFSPNFFRAIGHMVVARALADLLRDLRGDDLVLTVTEGATANPWLARALTADFGPDAPPDRPSEPSLPAPMTLNAMADALVPVADRRGFQRSIGATRSATGVMSWAAARWIERGPVPSTEVAALRAEARRFLADQGGDPARFLVTLHVRDSGYRGPSYADGQRDGTIGRYDAAIDAVIAAGGIVVRLGDPAMTAMRPRDNVIDYAHSPARDARTDIALAAACRFHIGSASGMSFVPLLFGRPVLFTNWITLAHVVATPNTLYLPKALIDATGGRVPLEAQCRRYAQAIQTEHVEPDGLYFRENSEAEILDATRFLMAALEGDRLCLPESLVRDQAAAFAALGIDPAPVLPPAAMAAWRAGA